METDSVLESSLLENDKKVDRKISNVGVLVIYISFVLCRLYFSTKIVPKISQYLKRHQNAKCLHFLKVFKSFLLLDCSALRCDSAKKFLHT